jgi:hypothetical protein
MPATVLVPFPVTAAVAADAMMGDLVNSAAVPGSWRFAIRRLSPNVEERRASDKTILAAGAIGPERTARLVLHSKACAGAAQQVFCVAD